MILAFDLTAHGLFITSGSEQSSTPLQQHIIPLQGCSISTTLTASLLPAMQSLCSPLTSLTHIAVTRGPASFTGLRILLSTLQGLQFGSHTPFLAPTRFELLAHHAYHTHHLPKDTLIAVHIPTKQDHLCQLFRMSAIGPIHIQSHHAETPDHSILDEGQDLSLTLLLWSIHSQTKDKQHAKAPFFLLASEIIPYYGTLPVFQKNKNIL